MTRVVPWRWLGSVPYATALAAQRARREAVLAGTRSSEIWLLEHESVYTTGRRGDPDLDGKALPAPRFVVERGGLTTWHGPGQLVAWPLVDLAGRGGSVKGTIAALETAVIAFLDDLGVPADRRAGSPGVWTEEGKICAVGIHVRRGVSIHGLALNLAPDLAAFEAITPCGIRDAKVTSVAALLGRAPTAAEAAPRLGRALSAALG